ncbi:MAG TPA: lipoyl(octanoyl) transferase LipB [Bryobacteraceae bacterium]|jgi:lipoate-protein ligase B|nr:lipoyl(octanoyl) transferase LipB [Bryobacteraceae bacterium]
MSECFVTDLGRMSYGEAFDIQSGLASERKQGQGSDHLLFVEHPHVITMGRDGHRDNLLASESVLQRAGIELHDTDRGGDITYHGPGQIVGYPIVDLRLWKRDVGAFVRGIEQVLIDTLADFGIAAKRIAGLTGVWTDHSGQEAKIAAIGVHLSRWVSTHGWALNVSTDLRYFQYIVPCGLAKPVTSMAALGVHAHVEDVKTSLVRHFGEVFDREMQPPLCARKQHEVFRTATAKESTWPLVPTSQMKTLTADVGPGFRPARSFTYPGESAFSTERQEAFLSSVLERHVE